MKYLKYFNTNSEYQTYKESSDFVKPNVSLIVEGNIVNFSPFMVLPKIDTSELRTSFVQDYEIRFIEELDVLNQIYQLHQSELIIDVVNGTLSVRDNVYNITNEPLYINFLSKLSVDSSDTVPSWCGPITKISLSDTSMFYFYTNQDFQTFYGSYSDGYVNNIP